MKLCSCKKHFRRKGQRYCRVCHARASKRLRRRRKAELKRLRGLEQLHAMPLATIQP